MIKRISTSELRVGMYIHDIDASWIDHPFLKSRFAVKNEQTIQKIASAGLRHVYIDTKRGLDAEDGASAASVDAALARQLEIAAQAAHKETRVSAVEEAERARRLYRESTAVVRNLMEATRIGRQVDIAALDPLAERMVQSAFRNPHALAGISRIKTKDEYTFMHCVGVSALLVTFARELELPEQQIHELAIGGLVHDIGKSMVPQQVLNKPDRLNEDEFVKMKRHVDHSRELLQDMPGMTQTGLEVVLLHHERMDGTGYPIGLDGEKIGVVGRMSAIVDVYDALTSVRVYKEAWEPTKALKKLLEWSPDHFDSELVQRFIRCLGIYPVGSTVALESGRIGIVIDVGTDLVRPVLRVIYNTRHGHFERPYDVDLQRAPNERISKAVEPAGFGIDITQFI